MRHLIGTDAITDYSGQVIGHWDGEHIGDLLRLIMEVDDSLLSLVINNLPHQYQIPSHLLDAEIKIWACDKRGLCLIGDAFNQIEHVSVLQLQIEKKMLCISPVVNNNVVRFELKTLYSPSGFPIGYCFENNENVHTLITNYDGNGVPDCEEQVYWSCFDYTGNEIISGEAGNLAAALATFYRSDKIFAQINDMMLH